MQHEGFGLLADAVKDYAIFLLDPEGCVASWNPGAERIKGYTEAEALGHHFSAFYTAEDRQVGLPEHALEAARTEGRHESQGWRVRKDGTRFYAEATITALRNDDGHLEGFLKITRDITARQAHWEELRTYKQALETIVAQQTEELQEKQRTLELIYDASEDPMILFRVLPEGAFEILSCNQACAQALRTPREDLIGRSLRDALQGPTEPVLEAFGRAVAERAPQRLEQTTTTEGQTRIYDSEIIPVLDDAGSCTLLLVASRDITERVRMEESLRQSQKLESLGVLAGGIAHDFNNLLTAILGNANLGTLSLPMESPGRPFLLRIEEATMRAADLTRQLLAYAGKGSFVVTEVDLNRAVSEMTQLLTVTTSKRAVLRFDLARTAPRVKADPAQIQQLIMNLVTNASEAIGEEQSGVITLRTGLQHLDEAYLTSLSMAFPLEPGLYATLEVSDTGCGMTAETQARIFDPFFTTKFTGRGLGLSAMMGILRSHKGSLRLYSEVGRGTTFKLFLPAVSEPTEDAPPEETPLDWRTKGLVLLVDDEIGARSIGRQMSERVGLTVLEAADGHEGLEVFRARHAELSLVIMDLTMPRMGGREAYQGMLALDPKVPVILSSGYSEADAAQAFLGQGLAGFLQKPYRLQEFIAAVRQAVETR